MKIVVEIGEVAVDDALVKARCVQIGSLLGDGSLRRICSFAATQPILKPGAMVFETVLR